MQFVHMKMVQYLFALAALTPSSTLNAQPAPSFAGQSWTVLSLNGRGVVQPNKARISFTEDRLSATAGCNTLGGAYRIEKGIYLVTRQMLSTLIGCPDSIAEDESSLGTLLSSSPLISYASTAGEKLQIRLSSGKNEAVLELLP